MARHRLTDKEKVRGIKKALKNPRTPKQFRAPMKRYLKRISSPIMRSRTVYRTYKRKGITHVRKVSVWGPEK
jgi:hypothetical protein